MSTFLFVTNSGQKYSKITTATMGGGYLYKHISLIYDFGVEVQKYFLY